MVDAESPQPGNCPSVASVDSEIMKAPSIPKNQPVTWPSREFLSSLVLPAPSVLKEYLRPRSGCGDGCHGDFNNSNKAAALGTDNLLWFSTKGALNLCCRSSRKLYVYCSFCVHNSLHVHVVWTRLCFWLPKRLLDRCTCTAVCVDLARLTTEMCACSKTNLIQCHWVFKLTSMHVCLGLLIKFCKAHLNRYNRLWGHLC